MDQPPAPLAEGAVALLPMRNVVLFPNAVMPVAVGRARSVAAVRHALDGGRPIGIVLQRDKDEPRPRSDARPRHNGT